MYKVRKMSVTRFQLAGIWRRVKDDCNLYSALNCVCV